MNREIPSVLGVDSGTTPAFLQEWRQFKSSKPWAFLVLHLEVKKKRALMVLETAPLDQIAKLQSEIAVLRGLSEMMRRDEIAPEVDGVLTHTNEKINT